MEFFDLIRTRRSVRAFTGQTVTDAHIQAILEAANLAPSAGNLQAYEIYLVRQPKRLDQLARAAGHQEFLAQASLALVFCAHQERAAGRYGKRAVLYSLQDGTIACTYCMLAATALGLATVWVGAFDEEAVRQAIGARDALRPVVMLPIGYAGEQPEARPRRRLNELVHTV